jgi:arginase
VRIDFEWVTVSGVVGILPAMNEVSDVGRTVVLLGVPSSAGAHHAGQDLAPAALRRGGFGDRLVAAGVNVEDRGDIAGEVFAVDHSNPTQRNLAAVLRVARAVADAVEHARSTGAVAVVLGGDCTITLGVLSGVQRADPTAGVLYFDGDADLSTPARTRSGILDATGVAHLLGLADSELSRLDGRYPMLDDDRLVMLGYDETDPDSFDGSVFAQHPRLRHFADHVVRTDPAGVARQALSAVSAAAGSIIVHFDVDAVDSGDLPLGNFPHYGTGVDLSTASEVLRILCSAPGLAAIVLTEVNPTHDPDGTQLDRYIDAVSRAIGTALADRRRS